MPVTVVVGGQFGSEGKGKVAHWIARTQEVKIAVRVGGPNAGHTAINEEGSPVILRQLPTAALLPDVMCVLSPGCAIDPEVLLSEVARVGLDLERLAIDPLATLITSTEKERERASGLRQAIGSTLSGTGAALERRLQRRGSNCLASDDARLWPFLRPTLPLLRLALSHEQRVLIEGTQGFGLSLLHSRYYPHVTSRDTTAATFVGEVGLSPLDVDDIYLVLRAFPIRVGGNSGPLQDEVDWDTLARDSGSAFPLAEYTSVTRTLRRVARFDPELVREAIMANRPTKVVLNHLDHVDAKAGVRRVITPPVQDFLSRVESSLNRRIDVLGFGPDSLVEARRIAEAFAI